jgi:2-dehydro-3-deoxyphosphogluconate aldolase / (4S)-4-hydroxy-2-oxoglutarate aldolase
VLPVVTVDSADDAVRVGEALMAGELACAEVTFRTDAAPAAISAIVNRYPGMLVGAGTVLTVEQARQAAGAGASFVVSPGFDDDVVEWCLSHDIPVIPGVVTPTEISRAWRQGVEWMKFFPAEPAGGIATLKSLSAVFGSVVFVPTGGVDASNLADYLRLKSVAACGGSWLVSQQLIAEGDFESMKRLISEAVAIVGSVRGAG